MRTTIDVLAAGTHCLRSKLPFYVVAVQLAALIQI